MSRLETIQSIVKNKQCAKVDGILIDYVTAGLIVKIYKKLKDDQKEALMKMPIGQMVSVCWKMVK